VEGETLKVIGYDLDGTLCEAGPKRPKPYFHQTGPERKAFDEERRKHYASAALIREPRGPYVIITGRSEVFREETEGWLEKMGLKPIALLMMEGARTRDNMIAHKIDCCRRLKVRVYYEDDPKIAKAMAAAGIAVILVGARR
jgi:uncharacterized HAD superfamily protein